MYQSAQNTCQLGTLTHVILARDEETGITAGVPMDLPFAGENWHSRKHGIDVRHTAILPESGYFLKSQLADRLSLQAWQQTFKSLRASSKHL